MTFQNIYDPRLIKYLNDLSYKTKSVEIGMDKVLKHVDLSNDKNPVHLKKDLAYKSHFNSPVVHGPLIANVSTGFIHDIFKCDDFTYPEENSSCRKMLKSMPIGSSIYFVFTTDTVVLRNDVGRDPYLKVIYNIDGFVDDVKTINIKWTIKYKTIKFLVKNTDK